MAAVIVIAAFVLGAASNYLGSGGVINLLAIPVFGLIVWNLAMYVVLLVSGWFTRKTTDSRCGMIVQWVSRWGKKSQLARLAGMGEPWRKAAEMFLSAWGELAAEARMRLIRMVAHGAAISLAAGVLAGMYLRGLGYEFKAGWESTFLNAQAVETWLRILLGPGSAVTGIGIPPGEMAIAELDLAKGGGEKADRWIHLFASTTAIYIFVPRLLFMIAELVGLAKWRSTLVNAPVFADYYDKLAKEVSGGGQLVRVMPYHCSPEPKHRDTVRALLHQLWGGAAHVDFSEARPYGEEDELLDDLQSVPGYLVLLMSASTTPEGEAHGYILRQVQEKLRESGDDCKLLVLLDENRFRQRFEEIPEFARRLEERHAAWDELVKPLGIRIGWIDSGDPLLAESFAGAMETPDELTWSAARGGSAGF